VKRVRAYEVMFIVRPDLDDEAVDAIVEKYTDRIAGEGGEVTSVQKMGRRRLAYEIRGFRDGTYVVLNFNGRPSVAGEFERLLALDDEIVRHLLVTQESDPTPSSDGEEMEGA